MARNKKLLQPKNILFGSLLLTYIGVAVNEQLRRDPSERTWHGSLVGIPYDFRPPTIEKLRATYWNKDTSEVLVPQAFGVGWTVNLYPIVHPKTVQLGK